MLVGQRDLVPWSWEMKEKIGRKGGESVKVCLREKERRERRERSRQGRQWDHRQVEVQRIMEMDC